MGASVNDAEFAAIDYFKTEAFTADPYLYWDHLRDRCPVTKESPRGVCMVTGHDQASSPRAAEGLSRCQYW